MRKFDLNKHRGKDKYCFVIYNQLQFAVYQGDVRSNYSVSQNKKISVHSHGSLKIKYTVNYPYVPMAGKKISFNVF